MINLKDTGLAININRESEEGMVQRLKRGGKSINCYMDRLLLQLFSYRYWISEYIICK